MVLDAAAWHCSWDLLEPFFKISAKNPKKLGCFPPPWQQIRPVLEILLQQQKTKEPWSSNTSIAQLFRAELPAVHAVVAQQVQPRSDAHVYVEHCSTTEAHDGSNLRRRCRGQRRRIHAATRSRRSSIQFNNLIETLTFHNKSTHPMIVWSFQPLRPDLM